MENVKLYRVTRSVAVAVVSIWILFLLVGVAAAVSARARDYIQSIDALIMLIVGLSMVLGVVVWLCAVWSVATEEKLSSRKRAKWIVLLVILNLFAGVLYTIWAHPHSQKHRTADRV